MSKIKSYSFLLLSVAIIILFSNCEKEIENKEYDEKGKLVSVTKTKGEKTVAKIVYDTDGNVLTETYFYENITTINNYENGTLKHTTKYITNTAEDKEWKEETDYDNGDFISKKYLKYTDNLYSLESEKQRKFVNSKIFWEKEIIHGILGDITIIEYYKKDDDGRTHLTNRTVYRPEKKEKPYISNWYVVMEYWKNDRFRGPEPLSSKSLYDRKFYNCTESDAVERCRKMLLDYAPDAYGIEVYKVSETM